MKGGSYLYLIGLLFVALSFSSCDSEQDEQLIMHDVVIKITKNDNKVYMATYYALLKEKKEMDFIRVPSECLVVNIYADSTKNVVMTKVLSCDVLGFEIVEHIKTKANKTKVVID